MKYSLSDTCSVLTRTTKDFLTENSSSQIHLNASICFECLLPWGIGLFSSALEELQCPTGGESPSIEFEYSIRFQNQTKQSRPVFASIGHEKNAATKVAGLVTKGEDVLKHAERIEQ